jgi:hypothetical protein
VDSISQKLANEIAEDLMSNEGVSKSAALDFETITAIAKTLLSLATNCQGVLTDLNKLKNPGLINKIRLKRFYVAPLLREHLKSRLHLRILMGSLEKSVTNSVLRRGQTATADEVAQLIAEAKLANQNS